MALVVSVLEQQIVAAFEKQANKQSEGDDPANSIKELAADLAASIDAYIKTATVLSVVTGTSPAGPVTGTATSTTIS
jgi:hypothetical protein